jgi:hypothetical protein
MSVLPSAQSAPESSFGRNISLNASEHERVNVVTYESLLLLRSSESFRERTFTPVGGPVPLQLPTGQGELSVLRFHHVHTSRGINALGVHNVEVWKMFGGRVLSVRA